MAVASLPATDVGYSAFPLSLELGPLGDVAPAAATSTFALRPSLIDQAATTATSDRLNNMTLLTSAAPTTTTAAAQTAPKMPTAAGVNVAAAPTSLAHMTLEQLAALDDDNFLTLGDLDDEPF